jgi:GxxExxY protein
VRQGNSFNFWWPGPAQILPASGLSCANIRGKRIGALCALAARMTITHEELQELTEKIIGCAIEVHRTLGPGLLESVYRECLIIELRREHLHVDSERHLSFDYRGQRICGGLKLDLLVNGCVVVELKAVERLHPVYLAQVITYLKISGCPAGLLINFNSTTIRAGLRRLDHPDRYVKKIN